MLGGELGGQKGEESLVESVGGQRKKEIVGDDGDFGGWILVEETPVRWGWRGLLVQITGTVLMP